MEKSTVIPRQRERVAIPAPGQWMVRDDFGNVWPPKFVPSANLKATGVISAFATLHREQAAADGKGWGVGTIPGGLGKTPARDVPAHWVRKNDSQDYTGYRVVNGSTAHRVIRYLSDRGGKAPMLEVAQDLGLTTDRLTASIDPGKKKGVFTTRKAENNAHRSILSLHAENLAIGSAR